MYRAKKDNSELGLHVRTNSKISEFSKNSELLLWPRQGKFSREAIPSKLETWKSESASFTRLLKSLLVPWVLEETRQTWPMFSELKALVDSERFQVLIFTSKHDPMCHKKFRAIVFMYRAKKDNSELGLHVRTNSKISEFSKNSELLLWPPVRVSFPERPYLENWFPKQ